MRIALVRFMAILSLFSSSAWAIGAVDENSVTGKIDKLVATQAGVLIKIDSGVPANRGAGYDRLLLIPERSQTMISLVFKALDANREIKLKTAARRDMDELCSVERIIWK